MNAKLGDFRFSVELPHVSGGSTLFTVDCIACTEGYYPSEITSGKTSDCSDMYSFGVVSDIASILGQVLVIAEHRRVPVIFPANSRFLPINVTLH